MGMHRGAIDKTTVTTQPPARVMAHVAGVLQAMGVEIQQESTYRFRCIRPKKGSGTGAGPAALTQARTGEDTTHLAAPVPGHMPTSSSVASRCVSPLDSDSRPLSPFDSPILQSFGAPTGPGAPAVEVLYGSPPDDSHDEVRFSVELTRLEGLSGTYSLDVRRLKGGLRSYSFIYNTIRERASINRL
jgi:protein-serine/threonine kinase